MFLLIFGLASGNDLHNSQMSSLGMDEGECCQCFGGRMFFWKEETACEHESITLVRISCSLANSLSFYRRVPYCFYSFLRKELHLPARL